MSASKNRIYFLLQRAAHRLKTEADAALGEVGGLTTAQAAVMSIITNDGPVTQKHIATTLSQRESAVTAMASRLLKAGYIIRSRSSSDARAWELKATAAGRQAMGQMQKPFDQINARLDECIPDKDIDKLAENLIKIIEEFDT